MAMFRKLSLIISAGAVLTISGCASTTSENAATNEVMTRTSSLEAREKSLIQRENALTSRAQALDAAPGLISDLLPPNAKSGECYARVWAPATYRTLEDRVLDKEATSSIAITPAAYEWVTETVLAKEASSKLVKVAAVYGTETETIQTAAAQRVWRTDLARGAAPASSELLATAKGHGIDLDVATVGMCFHEHYRPATFGTTEQDVLLSEESNSVSLSTATYRTEEKTVLLKEASFRLVDVPATYKTVIEQVIDKPEHTIWKKGTGPIQRIDEATGEIMCLVDIPATYKTISKRVTVTPAGTKKIEIPAEYKTIKVRTLVEDAQAANRVIPEKRGTVAVTSKLTDAEFLWHEIHHKGEPTSTRTGLKICLTEIPATYKKVTRKVVKTPASFKKVEIPAEHQTIKHRKLVSAATEVRTEIPETYKMVSRQELVTEGHMQWRSILCQTNMTTERIRQIQAALQKSGYNPGPIDGNVGSETIQAVNAFQKANNLPVDRYLNIETVKALGVSHQ